MGGAVDVHGAALFPGLGVARKIIIVGGGTAGWVTACYLARMLSADLSGGAQITLIESPDIGAIGVGEGTFPSIRKTLNRIGLDERLLFREADATFKQGIRFVDWAVGKDEYYHLFAAAHRPEGLDLLPYWLLGEAGNKPWGEVRNVQAAVVDAMRGPKLPYQGDYDGALTYAYHFDAIAFAAVLQRHAVTLGVTHIADKVTGVCLAGDGAIDRLVTEANGELTADLYIDCTGFSAQLIGKALGIPFISRRDQLFVDRAVTVQVPYEDPTAPIQSCTISKAERAGWMWDIGLRRRRGIGYVYSSDHCGDDEAARLLAGYTGQQGKESSFRLLKFETGYRDVQWHRNCIAIGLSAGFMEPLEATGIGFAESAALLLAALFPWNGPMEPAAVQFNAAMRGRYANVLQFIKAHYCLTKRRDSDFWIDNCRPESIPDGLKDKLERWRYRVPDFVDVDYGVDTFIEDNWRQVIYGMGFRTDLTARAGALRHHDAARRAFAAMDTNRARAVATLPPHRELVEQYSAGQSARMQAR